MRREETKLMFFARPLVLLLIAIPLGFGWWEFVRRGHQLLLPFDHGRVRQGKWTQRMVNSANLLPAVLLAVVIVLLAGPKKICKPTTERSLTNIQFCLDVSGSMTTRFGEGSQYDAAMDCIREFTSYREGDAFGLTIFGCEVLHWLPLTKDLSAMRTCTPFLRPGQLPSQFSGTSVGKGVRACADILCERPEGDRMIILISDGESSDLPGQTASNIGNELASESIIMFAIHVGSRSPPDDLYSLTEPTGGQVFLAQDPVMLKRVFHHIDRMQPIRMKPSLASPTDNFLPIAVTGLVVLAVRVLCLFSLRYTPW
jgi:Ca-activated chloride channel family protein